MLDTKKICELGWNSCNCIVLKSCIICKIYIYVKGEYFLKEYNNSKVHSNEPTPNNSTRPQSQMYVQFFIAEPTNSEPKQKLSWTPTTLNAHDFNNMSNRITNDPVRSAQLSMLRHRRGFGDLCFLSTFPMSLLWTFSLFIFGQTSLTIQPLRQNKEVKRSIVRHAFSINQRHLFPTEALPSLRNLQSLKFHIKKLPLTSLNTPGSLALLYLRRRIIYIVSALVAKLVFFYIKVSNSSPTLLNKYPCYMAPFLSNCA